MNKLFILGFTFLFVGLACNNKLLKLKFNTLEQIQSSIKMTSSGEKIETDCHDNNAYAPDDPTTFLKKKIRVNFHIMDSEAGGNNFPPEIGDKYIKNMLWNANTRLSKNKKMNLPIGNDTPILDPGYRYVLTPNSKDPDKDGIYYHKDDELYFFVNKGKNRNNFKRDVIKKYGINTDSIINIFVMPHHPDSLKSKKYKGGGTGIALGSSLKVAGLYDDKLENWAYATLLNHEIGHVMGLKHSWYKNDGCEDTPPNANCWSGNGAAPCDDEIVSNNVMDYNASQMSFSPCQLGIVHRNISRINSLQRSLVHDDWCNFNSEKKIIINTNTHWSSAKDLNKDIIIESGAELMISCRISMAKGATIEIKEGGKLILNGCKIHNACGDTWGGIHTQIKANKSPEISIFGDVLLEDVATSNQN